MSVHTHFSTLQLFMDRGKAFGVNILRNNSMDTVSNTCQSSLESEEQQDIIRWSTISSSEGISFGIP